MERAGEGRGAAVNSHPQHESLRPPGRIEAENSPDWLQVVTGLPDDPRAPLTPEHPIFETAQDAWRNQGDWSDEEHYGFWRGMLGHWPRPCGRRPNKDHLGEIANFTATTMMLSRAEIAELLSVDRETARRSAYVGHGEDLECRSGLDNDPDSPRGVRAPFVFSRSEDPPDIVVPHVTDYVGQEEPPPNVDDLWDRVWMLRRKMVETGELRQLGPLWVRGDDVEQAIAMWRRLQAQAGLLPAEIPDLEQSLRSSPALQRDDRTAGLAT